VGAKLLAQLEVTKVIDELDRDNVIVSTKEVRAAPMEGLARAKALVRPRAVGAGDN